jgi:hypothetical protein
MRSAVASSPAAYIASLASIAATRPTSSFVSLCQDGASLPTDSRLHDWVKDALSKLAEQFRPEAHLSHLPASSSSSSSSLSSPSPSIPFSLASHVPPTHLSLFSHYSSQPSLAVSLQKTLVQQAEQHTFDAMMKSVEERGDKCRVAHLKSIIAPYASAWKYAFPSCNLHTLRDEQYRIAARLNLGLPPSRNQLPDDCPSCGTKNAIARDAWHHLSCQRYKRREITHRHNAVLRALTIHARQAGAFAQEEPIGLDDDSGKRPDLQLVILHRHIISDVVVSHPLCPSHLDTAATSDIPSPVAEEASQKKLNKYTKLARARLAELSPFSIEATGGMSKLAIKLVDQIVLGCRDHLALDPHQDLADGVRHSVAIAVQKGNAEAILAGYSSAVMRHRVVHAQAA